MHLLLAAALAVTASGAVAAPIDFSAWNQTLQAHVVPGIIDGIPLHVVDYGGLRADPGLAAFLTSVRACNNDSCISSCASRMQSVR